MRPYSHDLRERIVAAVDRGEHSLRQLASLFAVSLSCLVRLLRHRRDMGAVTPKPPGGGHPPAIDEPHLERLCELLGEAAPPIRGSRSDRTRRRRGGHRSNTLE